MYCIQCENKKKILERGHMNEEETEKEAIEREVYEETSLNLTYEKKIKKIGTLIVNNNKNREKGIKVIHVYELITEEIPAACVVVFAVRVELIVKNASH